MSYKVVDVHVKTFIVLSMHVLKYQREEGTIYWGIKTLENTVTEGGKNDIWVGNSLYVQRGPGIFSENQHFSGGGGERMLRAEYE